MGVVSLYDLQDDFNYIFVEIWFRLICNLNDLRRHLWVRPIKILKITHVVIPVLSVYVIEQGKRSNSLFRPSEKFYLVCILLLFEYIYATSHELHMNKQLKNILTIRTFLCFVVVSY